MSTPIPNILTIAGSDSGGGAGIQADLKTFHSLRTHGLSAITAVTSQNTLSVMSTHTLPLSHVRAQIEAVFSDFRVAAVKTGMLGTAAITKLVAREMAARRPAWLVVDPVMIATTGTRLFDENALEALVTRLIPLTDILTPNLPEAEVILGRRVGRALDEAGADLLALGCKGVLLKGGHGSRSHITDHYYRPTGMLTFRHPRLPFEGHGSGCTLASAVAAHLARGKTPQAAVEAALRWVERAFLGAWRPGSGAAHVLAH